MTAFCYSGCVSQPSLAQITCHRFWELLQVDLHEFLRHCYCLYIYRLWEWHTRKQTYTTKKTRRTPPLSRNQHGACHWKKQKMKTRQFYIILNEKPATKLRKIDSSSREKKNKGFQELCMIRRRRHDYEMIDIRGGKQKSEILGVS